MDVQATIDLPLLTRDKPGLMPAGTAALIARLKERIDTLEAKLSTEKEVLDDTLTATAEISSNGCLPNSPRVLITGTVTTVSLPTIESGRHAIVVTNTANCIVTLTAPETIVNYPTGIPVSSGESATFSREPKSPAWRLL